MCKLIYKEVIILDFVALDFETANASRNSACALGLAVVERGEIVNQLYWLIQPPTMYFLPYNLVIHGITEEDVINEPTFDLLWDEIYPHLKGKMLVAHNAAFDISVLKSMLDTYDIPYPENDYFCSVTTARKTWPDLSSYKLNAMAEMLNITFRHHHALEDAMVSAQIMIEACKKFKVSSITALGKKFKIQPGHMQPVPKPLDLAVESK
jgi:DNA polymerase-3 subunit epsilon